MKVKRNINIAVMALLLTSSAYTHAIVGIGIERQCTNIVVSWPSTGSEHYLIQHRPTLDPSTPWTNLTNNYPANSTNRTTFTVYGVTPPCSGGGGSSMMAGSGSSGSSVGWPKVMPKDGSRPPVPLNLYPYGIDLTGQIVLWPDGTTEEWTKEFAEKYHASKQNQSGEQNGPQGAGGPENGGGGSARSQRRSWPEPFEHWQRRRSPIASARTAAVRRNRVLRAVVGKGVITSQPPASSPNDTNRKRMQ